jgi:hypothetical protein
MEEIPDVSGGLPALSPGYEYRSFRNSYRGPLSSEFLRVRVQQVTGFPSWLAAHSLSGSAADPTADPDGDNESNLVEFALDSNPNSGISSGKVREWVNVQNGTVTQILTLPMRLGAKAADWDPAGGELVFEVEGIRYRIQGSTNYISWTLNMEEIPDVSGGLPALSPGYEYRSFQNSYRGPLSSEFLRVRVQPMY